MKQTTWLIFGVFCLLSSGASLIPTAAEPDAALEQHGLLYLTTALVILIAQRRKQSLLANWRQSFSLCVTGITLLGIPALLVELVAGSVSAFTVSAVFAMLPIPVILVLTQQDADSGRTGGLQRFFTPALVAITGLLFLIPTELPHSTRGITLLTLTCLCLIVIAIASVRIYSRLQETTITQALSIILFSNGCFLLAVAAFAGRLSMENLHPVSLLSISNVLYLLENILLIVLFRRLAPLLLSARYLLVPLLTILQGIILLRPELTLRMGCGLLLMIGGLAWFFATASVQESHSSSLLPH